MELFWGPRLLEGCPGLGGKGPVRSIGTELNSVCQESSLNLKPFPASMTTHSTMKHQALAAAMTDLAGVGDMDGVPERQERGKREKRDILWHRQTKLISVLSILRIRNTRRF